MLLLPDEVKGAKAPRLACSACIADTRVGTARAIEAALYVRVVDEMVSGCCDAACSLQPPALPFTRVPSTERFPSHMLAPLPPHTYLHYIAPCRLVK
jgi:hypothetical protein